MTTPDIIARALAGDQEALSRLRKVIDQAAHGALGVVLHQHSPHLQLDAKEETLFLDAVFAKLCAHEGRLVRDWNSAKGPFDAHVRAIAERHAHERFMRSIIERALAGDGKATDALLEAFDRAARPAIGAVIRRAWVHRRVRDANADMKELLQDVFVKLWKNNGEHLLEWDPNLGSFNTYIGRIAERHAIDKYRGPGKKFAENDDDVPDAPDEKETPEQQTEMMDFRRKILDGMRGHLKGTKQQQMFSLLVEQGLTVEEICRQSGASADSVYQWREFFKKLAGEVRNEIASNPAPSARKKTGNQK